MFTDRYSDKENEVLLNELTRLAGGIHREMFDDLQALWPGLFQGRTRHQRALFRQMVSLAKKNKIPYTIVSTPIRDPKYHHKKVTVKPSIPVTVNPLGKKLPKIKFQEQVLAIIRSEQYKVEKRIARRIAWLVTEINAENANLKAEIKELRSFKKDSEITRNDRSSPIMERHYI